MEGNSKHISEFMDELQEEDIWSSIYLQDESIIFSMAGDYDIELSSCKTPERILSWVLHLSSKSWVTPEILRVFISRASAANDIVVPKL